MEEEQEISETEEEEAPAASGGPEEMEDDIGGDDDEGGGDDDGEEDEDGYQLQFDGDIDPLDLENNHGADLYRHFQRLEYEALADRKRKAAAALPKGGQTRDEPAKRMRPGTEASEFAELDELMFGARRRRRSRGPKKRGRKKGSKKKLNPEIAKKISEAARCYAIGDHKEAIRVLVELVRLPANFPEPYHWLGLIYDELGDRPKALNFHMIAAHLMPKDPSIWRKLLAWSIEQEDTGLVKYFLSKAITADPENILLRLDRAALYSKLHEHEKAAKLYEQILELDASHTEACLMSADMYRKCGQVDRALAVLEGYASGHLSEANPRVVCQLVALYIETNAHDRAIHQIELAISTYGSMEKLPYPLQAKAAICYAHSGNMENVEALLRGMQINCTEPNADLIMEVADSIANLGNYECALKCYSMLEGVAGIENGMLHLKIAQCYASKNERGHAISFFYKALSAMGDDVDARITLSSLLVEEGKGDEAILILSPPKGSQAISECNSSQLKPWWLSGKVRMQLGKIYFAKGMLGEFADTIFPLIRESLTVESTNLRKVKAKIKPRLTKNDLFNRARLLDDQQTDNILRGFRPNASTADLRKAYRAKKLLQKREALREKEKAAALAAGMDWQSESSEDEDEDGDEAPGEMREPPLPGLLEDEEYHQITLDLANSLTSLQRYWEAFEIIYHTLRLSNNKIDADKIEELRALGAQIAYKTRDPKHGYQYARYIVNQNPNSVAAWNCYFNIVSRFESRYSRHLKFINRVLAERTDLIPPILIHGHQFTHVSQHQSAARLYLEAYKVKPDDPLINLCVGTALVNIALGHRLQNKNQCLAQGLAFLHNNVRICNNSQEALYNIARAYHHVGLVTLAAHYYEKVLKLQVDDYPIPKLPNEDTCVTVENHKPGYCNLHREAAHNLHLIYKKSGAVDLARQVLKDYCTP